MSRTAKVQLAAALAALMLVSLMVVRASSAVFSGTTENAANSWSAGEVTLTDDDNGNALYTSSGLVPGSTAETQCIEVTYTGSVTTSGTALYATVTDTDAGGAVDGATAAEQLSDDLDVVVRIGDTGVDCTTLTTGNSTEVHNGTLGAFPADFASGGLSWTPASGTDTMRAFEFTVSLGTNTPDDAQGDSATATFTWEAQS